MVEVSTLCLVLASSESGALRACVAVVYFVCYLTWSALRAKPGAVLTTGLTSQLHPLGQQGFD